jgi:glycosyltransferase involved in cell wall biosynthesis
VGAALKILLVNHGSAGDFRGGDAAQIRHTARWLERFGHRVVAEQTNQPDCRGFDLVHVFNCRHADAFAAQVDAARQQGLPVVVSPIWIPLGEALWGSRTAMAVLQQAVGEPARAGGHFHNLRQRSMVLQLGERQFNYPVGDVSVQEGNQRIGAVLQQVDALLPNSWLELQSVRRDLLWHGGCFGVAPYGVDPVRFLDADPEPFRRWSGIEGPFVLQAGRVEPAKNPAMLLWALKDMGLKVVLAGGTKIWPEYVDLCRAIGADRLTLVEHLPPELLASAYAAASCHALPSWCETCGLVSLEAALSGTPVVGSTAGHEVEYLQGDAWLADPADPASIRLAVEQAMAAGRDSERPRRLRQRVLEQYSWLRTTEATEALYRRVLG